MEYARNVLGIRNAGHEETADEGAVLIVSRLVCSLAGVSQPIALAAGSRAAALYGLKEAVERFTCNYGLNPLFRDSLDWGRLKITGTDGRGDARVVELFGHPFFVATLFLPQLSSRPEKPHPLVLGFLRAALEGKRGGLRD